MLILGGVEAGGASYVFQFELAEVEIYDNILGLNISVRHVHLVQFQEPYR